MVLRSAPESNALFSTFATVSALAWAQLHKGRKMNEINKFSDLDLKPEILKAVNELGYEVPFPIQAQIIPAIQTGRDVLGQAQTGTGKTAAFALPIINRIDTDERTPQALVLTPTRELAIQVSEAFQRYAKHVKGFRVLPIYGGQEYGNQLRSLKKGVQVVVGTPGRVMDHIRRGTLELDELKILVLDEADEMLKMGFQEDVEWILDQIPEKHQIALFSATVPNEIRKIARKYQDNPEEITIKSTTTTVETTRQRYLMVRGYRKMDALTRVLEAEPFDAAIIFARTRMETVEISEKLEARGYSSSAINGDIAQNQRERTIEQLKSGKINILVATDVAARGLDVDRITHVINYDVPFDTEAYVHRIGRTGRAGKSGDAILFLKPKEKYMLREIEEATRQKIELMELPSTSIINDNRITGFKQKISDTLAENNLDFFRALVESYRKENDVPSIEIAAALAKLVQGEVPLLLEEIAEKKERPRHDDDFDGRGRRPRSSRSRNDEIVQTDEEGMETYRVEVGHCHGVKPGNIVGAIAGETGMPSKDIGRIQIYEDFSTVDLPVGLRFKDLRRLSKATIVGQRMAMSKVGDPSPQADSGEVRDENSTRRPPPFHEKAHKRPAGKSVGFSSPRKSYGKSNDRSSNKRRLRSRRDRA